MTIYLHDFSRPLHERLNMRRHCGPYQWTPAKSGAGRGFYQASGSGLECGDSTFRLRLEPAGRYTRQRSNRGVIGFYCDRDGDGDTLKPIIARLPHGRGFLAGWTMGPGMCASLDADIYPDEETAADAAYSVADGAAEHSREMQEDDE